jgi:hypothetical protein
VATAIRLILLEGAPMDRALLREIYDRVDADRDGQVTKNELVTALRKGGVGLCEVLGLPRHTANVRKSRSLQRYFADTDREGDSGALSWEEFLACMERATTLAICADEAPTEDESATDVQKLEKALLTEKGLEGMVASEKSVDEIARVREMARGILLDVAGEAVYTSLQVECRICREEGFPEDEMVNPCHCDGSMKWVHPECLNIWRHRSADNLVHCTVCKAKYDFVRRPTLGNYLRRCHAFMSSSHRVYRAMWQFLQHSLHSHDVVALAGEAR